VQQRRSYIVYFQDSEGTYHCEKVRARNRLEANAIVRTGEGIAQVYGARLPADRAALQRQLLQRLKDESEEPG